MVNCNRSIDLIHVKNDFSDLPEGFIVKLDQYDFFFISDIEILDIPDVIFPGSHRILLIYIYIAFKYPFMRSFARYGFF